MAATILKGTLLTTEKLVLGLRVPLCFIPYKNVRNERKVSECDMLSEIAIFCLYFF
jgi:hypothetical protein